MKLVMAGLTVFALSGCTDTNPEELTSFLKSQLGLIDGTDGLSAYELAIVGGFQGTEVEWMNSLRGEAGLDGEDGEDGEVGEDGLIGTNGENAYELAILAGFEGTLEEWLVSLMGAAGPAGATGATGTAGANGTDGTDGVCPNCEAVEPEPMEEGVMLITFRTGSEITNAKVGYMKNGLIQYIEDATVNKDENDVTTISYEQSVTDSAEYMMGIQFDY